jgi:16S rRNA (adenine1518-N6/adenine1519-N6)-dimethyltransferase
VLCTSVCKVRIAFDLGASSFWPAPNVTSSVVVLEPRPSPVSGADRRGFSSFVRAGFATRRKTLKNNLKAWGKPEAAVIEALNSLGIREDVRAEALDPEELAKVYEALKAGSA